MINRLLKKQSYNSNKQEIKIKLQVNDNYNEKWPHLKISILLFRNVTMLRSLFGRARSQVTPTAKNSQCKPIHLLQI